MLAVAMTPEIGITEMRLHATVAVLTQVLSDEHVLYIKLRNYHWNVTGSHFTELHGLFAEQFGVLATHIDNVAERIRALGARAPGTMTEYLQRTALREHAGRVCGADEMLRDLQGDHESIIRFIRESLELPAGSNLDLGSSDLLTGVMRDHEKMAWMLRAILTDSLDCNHQEKPIRYSMLYE
jgi:starvation-inducible DNA-binding protein